MANNQTNTVATRNTAMPSNPLIGPDAAGLLVVSAANPRYFTVASGNAADRRAVYLTGSHVWTNLQDGVDPDPSAYESFEPAHQAMGDTLRYAQRMKLTEMEPRGDLSSTGYALANPGKEYLVLQPSESADPFTVELEAGTYIAHWHSVTSHKQKDASNVTVAGDRGTRFMAPFGQAGPTVSYLKKAGR